MDKLKGKVAIVTGASKGIGAGIARQLAADGAQVVVNYASSASGAERVVGDIQAAGGKALAVRADVTNKAEVEALVNAAIDRFGRLDIVVNNSSVYQFARIEETTEARYREQFDINVSARCWSPAPPRRISATAAASSTSAPTSRVSFRPRVPSIAARKAQSTPSPGCSRGNSARAASGSMP